LQLRWSSSRAAQAARHGSADDTVAGWTQPPAASANLARRLAQSALSAVIQPVWLFLLSGLALLLLVSSAWRGSCRVLASPSESASTSTLWCSPLRGIVCGFQAIVSTCSPRNLRDPLGPATSGSFGDATARRSAPRDRPLGGAAAVIGRRRACGAGCWQLGNSRFRSP